MIIFIIPLLFPIDSQTRESFHGTHRKNPMTCIQWTGLVAPHIARTLVGSNMKCLLPCSAGIGATILLVTDSVSRIIIQDCKRLGNGRSVNGLQRSWRRHLFDGRFAILQDHVFGLSDYHHPIGNDSVNHHPCICKWEFTLVVSCIHIGHPIAWRMHPTNP